MSATEPPEHAPFIDHENIPAPREGVLVTHFIAVRSVARSRAFYSDKPDISVVNYEPGNTVSSFLNLRVADIEACHQQWSAKGAEFVTPPIDRRAEIRCYMRDPDGSLIEVGQATGALHGELAEKRAEDLPG
jgi:hypothetical protein